ncbi:DDE-type integrase/transposase/recombinase [Pseudomonas chlororaphis]|uniref:DDE-type integrase/transposase/recombinase n=1 Tax=Pseudomonas chlororaphis TaxID=587753 RepID=UPI001928B0F7|nr:DDE-type integrase/transposase/recombinase [Pseudomonas chlororaphis]QQX57098.1 DDE-type integrase/transposase/recombinase [Pseudomonas chlororaphis subsp. aurantiaca]
MNETLQIIVGEHYRFHGADYQVMDIDGERIQLRSLQVSKSPVFQTFECLARAHQNGVFRKTQEAPFAPNAALITAALSPRHKTIMERRLRFLQPILDRWGGRLPRKPVEKLAKEIATQLGQPTAPSYGALYLWRKAYLAGGENSLALVPKTRRRTLHRLYRQPEVVQELIRLNIDQLYFCRTPCSKTEVIDAIDCAIRATNQGRSPIHQLAVPSSSTLYRIISELDRYETDRHQVGYHVAIKNQKWSRRFRQPYRRFERVEGDTHELDIETCDANGYPVGRAFLTVLLEVRTRMIVGWDISYNSPSLEKTIRALKYSLLSGNPYGGLALNYRFDNGGDYIADRLKSILSEMGSHITYCEPDNPDQKPHVESFFKSWTTSIVHSMRGTTFSTPNPYDSESNAIYTLDNLKERFEDWRDTVYHANFHSGIEMSPKELWEQDEADRHEFELKKYSEEDLNRYFLSAAYVTPNNGRLRFRGIAWTGPAVSFLAGRRPGKRKSLRLLYDTSELGYAWVCDPEQPNQVYRVEAVAPDYQVGLTMHMHELVKARLGSKKRSIDYRAARDARVRILHELASANNKRRRKNREIANEHGDFKQLPALDCRPPAGGITIKAEEVDQYHLHPETPANYQVVVANHDSPSSK